MTADWSEIFPSSPITGETAATVELVGNDWRADEDWRRFKDACREAARRSLAGNHVDPNEVRAILTDSAGRLRVNPRRLSAFYHRAAGKGGFLRFSHWGINDDAKGRNKGKPARIYALGPERSP